MAAFAVAVPSLDLVAAMLAATAPLSFTGSGAFFTHNARQGPRFPGAAHVEVMQRISTTESDNAVRCLQQLVADAVELAGSISPLLKVELVSILATTFPLDIVPTTGQQKASLSAVWRMFEFAKGEAAQISTLQNARSSIDACLSALIRHAGRNQFASSEKFH